MSYTDGNGLILIDEVAAANDIAKLESAKIKVDETLNYVNQIIVLNSELSGATATAINDSATLYKTRLETQRANIEITISNIRKTVEIYHAIDSRMKDHINNANLEVEK